MATGNAFNQPEQYDGLFRHFSSYYRRFLDLIVDAGDINPSFSLDLGCGTGDFTALIATRFPRARIAGVDVSSAYIGFAKARHPRGDIQFHVSPAQSLPGLRWVGEVDTIFIKGAYHLFEQFMPIEKFALPTFRSLRTIVIIEKTSRSLDSYPVPQSAAEKRRVYVSAELATRRMRVPAGASLKSVSFGETIQVPALDYLEAVRSRQFSYLDASSDAELETWLSGHETATSISLFEENVANIYQL